MIHIRLKTTLLTHFFGAPIDYSLMTLLFSRTQKSILNRFPINGNGKLMRGCRKTQGVNIMNKLLLLNCFESLDECFDCEKFDFLEAPL